MAAAETTLIQRDVEALRRVVEQAVERLPASELTALRQLLKRTLHEARHLDAPKKRRSQSGLAVAPLAPKRRRAYFPVASSPTRAVSRSEIAEANRGWEAAFGRGQSYREAALAEVGSVFTPAEVASRLGVSTVTVNNWRRRNRLLAFRFDDHQYLYPAFQFVERPEHGERGVLRHLDDVLACLPFSADWARVRFFLTPSPALNGRTPLDVLRRGTERDFERLTKVASRAGDMGS